MRLIVAGEHLPAAVSDGGRTRVDLGDGLTATVQVPIPAPEHPRAWAEAVAGRCGRGEATRILARDRHRTATGWPIGLLDLDVVDASGAVVEARLVGFYQILRDVAVVTVRARARADLQARRARLLSVLAAARPDWSDDGIVALDELFQSHGAPNART